MLCIVHGVVYVMVRDANKKGSCMSGSRRVVAV